MKTMVICAGGGSEVRFFARDFPVSTTSSRPARFDT